MSKKTRQRPEDDPTSIGRLIVDNGFMTEDTLCHHLEEFFAVNESASILLGQFLVGKGFITQAQLDVLLLRQDAMRNGGIKHRHVMEAMKVASRVSDQLDADVSNLQAVLKKVNA